METELENGDVKEQEEEGGMALPPEKEAAILKARVEELEKTLAERNAELLALTESSRKMEETRKTLEDSLTEAVDSYKTLVADANPVVPAEMITGESVGAIDASLGRAKALVLRVRQGIESEKNGMKVPSGAPERSAPDLSNLSPIEKIKHGLGARR